MSRLAPKFLLVGLALTGTIPLAVLAMPSLVVTGIWLLIVPGLILAVTPSVFLYLFAFSVAWFAGNRHGKVPPSMADVICVLLLGIGVAVPDQHHDRSSAQAGDSAICISER